MITGINKTSNQASQIWTRQPGGRGTESRKLAARSFHLRLSGLFCFCRTPRDSHPNLEPVIYPNLEAVIERELAPFANRTHLVVYLTTTKAVVVSSCSSGSAPGAWQGERSQRSECG